ncbi:MAG: RluA family pseudouridine synthase [Alphaproteobacteria bacterium]|nr:MAG: RluA family pseudouridine synthase [Alphaproteobacteria bacterium]
MGNFANFSIEDRLIYRDALILGIDKPAGLPVHKGPGGGAHLGQFLDALKFGLPRKPELAHRLDKDTSGVLILGRNPHSLRELQKIFSQNKAEKIYWAVARGMPPTESGTIDAKLYRHLFKPGQLGFRMIVDDRGQDAITEYKVLARKDDRTLLELKPQTGRTHQLRAHCAHIGCPIIGDRLYGVDSDRKSNRLFLHAKQIALPLYKNKPPISIQASLPTDWPELQQNI